MEGFSGCVTKQTLQQVADAIVGVRTRERADT